MANRAISGVLARAANSPDVYFVPIMFFTSFLSGRQFSFCHRHIYSLDRVDGGVKRPVCDVRHIPLCKPMVHSAIFTATDSGVSIVRSTAIGMNIDISPATNAFVRNVRYASATGTGL